MSRTQSLAARLLTVDASALCVAGAITAAAYYFGVMPRLSAEARLSEQRQLLDEQTRNAANTESLILIEQKKLAELKIALRDTSVPLFPPTDIHKRLHVITQLSKGNDLTITSLEPGVARTDPVSGRFAEVPIRMVGTGSYAGVCGMLTELLSVAYPDVEVRALTLAAAPESGGEPSFSIELRWYTSTAEATISSVGADRGADAGIGGRAAAADGTSDPRR